MDQTDNPYASPAEPEPGDALATDLAELPPAKPYASARTRAVWAIMFLAAILAGSIVSGVSDYLQIELLQRMENGDFTTEETHWNDSRQQLIGFVLIVASIGSMISFLMWFHRAHRNLRSLGATELRFSPGWAVGWWFIPIFNLFRPFQVMREIWRNSVPTTVVPVEDTWQRPTGSALVGWWWALFLVMNWSNRVVMRITDRATSIEELAVASWLGLASALLIVLAALLAILVVYRVTANQEKRFRLLMEGGERDAAQL
ncbi:MAG TPA: DUF4328 domain-containing protein [Thermoguttaceae bacterium]|nr:DUF4328 domain-containing protein [Thermoguttaceae bacterium]